MLRQNISRSIHLFDFEGQKIAFNGDSYQIALVDDVGCSTISHYQTGEDRDLADLDSEIYSFITNDSLPLINPKRLEATNTKHLDMICLLITSKCNLKCDYCFNDQGSYSFLPTQNMGEKTAMNAVSFLLNNCGEHATISFFGGEPTLRFSFIKKIVEFAKEKAKDKILLNFSIATNGTLITDEIAQFLRLNNFAIVYSIDGGNAIHDYHRKFPHGTGSFQLALQGAEKILATYNSQNKIVFRGTYTHQNKEFNDAYTQLVDSGFKNISIEPAVGKSSDLYAITMSDLPELSTKYRKLAKDYWKTYLYHPDISFFHLTNLLKNLSDKQKHDVPCGAAIGYITIAPNGDIYPCHRIVDTKYRLGNVNDISLNQPLISPLQNEFYNATVVNRPGCQNCWAKWLCGGSCYARNIDDDKNILDQHPVDCALMKIRIEAAIWIYLQQELLIENLDMDAIFQNHHIKVLEHHQEIPQNSVSSSCGKFCELIGCQVSCESSCTSSCTGNCTTSCEPFF